MTGWVRYVFLIHILWKETYFSHFHISGGFMCEIVCGCRFTFRCFNVLIAGKKEGIV